MKKKTRKHARRNAAPPAPRPAPRTRRFLPPIPDPPDWKTTLASAVGGGGSALVGGFLANRGWDPQMVGIAMTTGGVVGALTLPGPWRVAANGVAAAGAGQLALATMHKAAVDKVKTAVAGAPKPSNALMPPAVSGAFESYGRDYGPIDDEERMIDPDLELHPAYAA
ncbi:MAG: hypothetical protein H0T46_00555 [Deltaproteobacteria bacterium]|nr:hypothetical protein [Deltaproteobacteria bacterium]